MKRSEAIQFLKENPVFWSRLGFCYDPPLKNEQGKPLVFTEDLEKFAKYHRSFAASGVKIQTCILHSGWMGVEEFDYSLTDRVMEAVFRENPDAFYIPRIKLNVPVDWCRENPEEVFVYYEGPREAESVRALVDTPQQDWLGYEAPNGYYRAGDYVDHRPNVNGQIARQSFSSKVWLRDAGIALEKLIDRLENGLYGSRILGYHVSFGVSGESVLWGRASNHYGDYGIAHTRHFVEWGLKKYGSMEKLRQVWGEERFREEQLVLPSPKERYSRNGSVAEFFRADTLGTVSADMDEFLSISCADAVEYFGKIVRRMAPEKLVGTFYGYFLHTDNPNYAGHLDLERLLQSEYVDFFAAPKSYYRCGPGQPGGEMCTVQSVNRKKLWLDETDVRTHLADGDIPEWLCETFEDSRCVLWREFCKNLSHNSGFWWMDLGGGWFDDPALMEEVGKMARLNEKLQRQPYRSPADVLVLVDEAFIQNMSISTDLRCGFMEDPLAELHRCGVVADLYRLTDLTSLDLKQYKLIIFAYTFCVTPEQQAFLQKAVSPDVVLVYHYVSGIRDGSSCSLENVRAFTGFAMEEVPREADGTSQTQVNDPSATLAEHACPGCAFPKIRVSDPQAEALFTADDGTVQAWQKDRKIAVTEPYIQAQQLRQIANLAGCHLWTDCGQIFWADNRLAGVFAKKELCGEIHFPETGSWREAFSGKVFRNVSAIDLEALQTNAAVFLAEA